MSLKLKAYPKYKDSGIEWIDKIPADWETKKLKYICTKSAVYGANIKSEEYTLYGIRFLRTTDITNEGELIPEENAVYVSPESVKEYILDNGDVLFSRSGTLGRCFLFNKDRFGECAYAGYLVKFKVDKENLPAFVYYFSKSKNFGSWMSMIVIESTIGNINGQKYANMSMPITSSDEQKGMILFLNKEISQINNLIKKYEKLIDLLKEKKTALISQVVTRGLNLNVKMKDSGVEWVGEIPEYWWVKRLKYVAGINLNNLGEKTRLDYELSYLDITNVSGAGEILSTEDTSFDMAPSRARRIPGRYNTIVSTVRTYLKAIAYLDNIPENLIVSTGFAVLHPLKEMCPKFLFYVARSKPFIEMIMAESKGVSYPAINSSELGVLPVWFPEKEEQRQIADYLDEETSKIDAFIEKINKQIELLKEHKTSLISHVVTGKIDVRGEIA